MRMFTEAEVSKAVAYIKAMAPEAYTMIERDQCRLEIYDRDIWKHKIREVVSILGGAGIVDTDADQERLQMEVERAVGRVNGFPSIRVFSDEEISRSADSIQQKRPDLYDLIAQRTTANQWFFPSIDDDFKDLEPVLMELGIARSRTQLWLLLDRCQQSIYVRTLKERAAKRGTLEPSKRRAFTAQEISNAISFLRDKHADLLQILEDVLTGKRAVIDRFEDNEYYEKDEYYPSMDALEQSLIDSGLAGNDGSESTDLFSAIRNEIRQRHGIAPG